MKLSGGRKKLKFRTTEKENTSKRRKILAAFVIVTVIIAIVSLAVLIKEYDFFSDKGDIDNGKVTSAPTTKMKEEVTVLFAGVPTDKSSVSFITYITMNTEKRTFVVGAADPKQMCNGKSLSQIYADNTEQELTDAVAKTYDIKIDRYIVVTEKKFKTFMGNLGSYELTLDKGISYQDGDFSLSLLSGKQTLTGDKLFKYIEYVGIGGSDYALEQQGKVIGELISQKLNENNTEEGDALFGKLVNNCNSNITIIDFSKYSELLSEISKEPKDVSVKLRSAEAE